MKVYYNSSLWNTKKGIRGFAQQVNWNFEYRDMTCFIPFVYRFSKGIVFDIISILDEGRLKEYIAKYESIEENLTTAERRLAEQEHPYQAPSIRKIWINDSKVEEGHSSSSAVNLPSLHENQELEPMKRFYSYILGGNTSFAYVRYRIPYPKTNSNIRKILRLFRLEKTKKIKFMTDNTNQFIPLEIEIDMDVHGSSKEITFEHPDTGTIHTINFEGAENIECPMPEERGSVIYASQSTYEVNPPLLDGHNLQFNSSISYNMESDNIPSSAGSIGFIGGAFGPTALFLSEKKSCISIPSFKREDRARFVIEGININRNDGKDYEFQIK